jgi:hypothetical protein
MLPLSLIQQTSEFHNTIEHDLSPALTVKLMLKFYAIRLWITGSPKQTLLKDWFGPNGALQQGESGMKMGK